MNFKNEKSFWMVRLYCDDDDDDDDNDDDDDDDDDDLDSTCLVFTKNNLLQLLYALSEHACACFCEKMSSKYDV